MLNRRDFLKVAGAMSAGAVLHASAPAQAVTETQAESKPNVLIFVFDAMSARHLSLYGYQRETTPYLAKFAERAMVYHSHYSAGNFTTAGVASMLTGLYPWTHRAINYRGLVRRDRAAQNLFNVVGDSYTRVAFTQNMFAELLLSQFGDGVDIHLPPDAFAFQVIPLLQSQDFPRDRVLAYFAFEDFMGVGVRSLNPIPGTVPLGMVDIAREIVQGVPESPAFPRGYPGNHSFYYTNEDVFKGITEQLLTIHKQSAPWFGYFHVWAPHGPYAARKDYVGMFPEQIDVPFKPRHKLSESRYPNKELLAFRLQYDEYIANVDAEFGTMITKLEQAGMLDDTYVIITSDHGELFERGELGHGTPLMYNPVVHVPLMIAIPEQTTRVDVYTATSSLDLLPTVAKITGNESTPQWAQGKLLPGFTTEPDDIKRSIYSFVAKNNSAFQDITEATVSLTKGGYELIYSTGYKRRPDTFELYNLSTDPHETDDLIEKETNIATAMQQELLDMFETNIQPFQRNQ